MKSYAVYRPDLDDSDALLAALVAQPGAYAIGTVVTVADGSIHVVTGASTCSVLTATPIT